MEALQHSEPTENPDPVEGRNWGLLLAFAVLLQFSIFRAGGLLWEGSAADGLPPDLRIQLNLAEQRELEILPRVGPQLASRIIEYRNQHFPLTDLSQLLEVNGIGPARLEEISGYLDLSVSDTQLGDARLGDEKVTNAQLSTEVGHGGASAAGSPSPMGAGQFSTDGTVSTLLPDDELR